MAGIVDLVKGSSGVILTVTVDSADPAYVFADVTGAELDLRVENRNIPRRTADSFAVVSDDLVITYTMVEEDLKDPGTLYIIPRALRPSGVLVGEERSLEIGI